LGGELRNSLGRKVTGICNAAFLLLVVSGAYLWFPKKLSMHHLGPGLCFGKGLRARARDLNWHKTIGFWSAIPLFFIVLTGVIMSYTWATDLLYRITGTEPPQPQADLRVLTPQRSENRKGEHRGLTLPNSIQDTKSLDELLTIVKGKVPAWRSITFRVPTPRDKSISFSVDKGNGAQPQERIQLIVSRASGEVMGREEFTSYNLGRKLRTIARFLHTGEILGISGQIIAALASLGGGFLVYTGFSLAIRRVIGWRKRKALLSRVAQRSEKEFQAAVGS
jgi:uncharacterized iron-regulated membrane protein